jgi:hypothetical protein
MLDLSELAIQFTQSVHELGSFCFHNIDVVLQSSKCVNFHKLANSIILKNVQCRWSLGPLACDFQTVLMVVLLRKKCSVHISPDGIMPLRFCYEKRSSKMLQCADGIEIW